MTARLERRDWYGLDGAGLRAAQRAELAVRYGSSHYEPDAAPESGEIEVFLVAYDEADEPIGCGALRSLGDNCAEITRMFVTPASRGTGVATALLRGLEKEASARGFEVLKLETGTAQPDAIRFFEREGYARIPNFGTYAENAESRCFTRYVAAELIPAR
jgi:putative acetyltransferase